MSPRPRLRRTGERAKCRFCSRSLPRPAKREHSLHPHLPGGKCPCGACYVIDPTGRNGGVALIEALQEVSGLKQGDAAMLLRNKDYEEFIENYEPRAHTFITGFKGYRRGMSRIYLVKLLEEPPEK
jgi:hypothetical protein